ncbi:MAG: LON peptidase substrate-binding domain-containing protein [Pseudomonadota bacterium]
MSEQDIPLFPLSTVLYPAGPLPLRLFETRYTDMVSRCMRESSPFAVVAIREGREVGPSLIYEMGTLATITDFYQGSDGLLGITAVGQQRFDLISERTQADGLRLGTVQLRQDVAATPLPARFANLAQTLDHVLDDLGKLYEGLPRLLDDADWVSHRFCEILPMTLAQKQRCLEIEDAEERLELVKTVLSRVPDQRSD